MTLVALIGVDGAGKTTVGRMLEQNAPWPTKYLYMGTAVQSSNVSLPLTRLVYRIKGWLTSRQPVRTPASLSSKGEKRTSRRPAQVGRLLYNLLRETDRVVEEWYRLAVARWYQRQGYLVVCDRYFLFEYATWRVKSDTSTLLPAERVHMWFLSRFYPEPDLVLLLDAPTVVLQARKPEWPLERLDRHRSSVLLLARSLPQFQVIDAAKALPAVYASVVDQISRHLQTDQRKT